MASASLTVVLLLSLVMCLWALNVSVCMATTAGKGSGASAGADTCDQQSNRNPNIALLATSDGTVHCLDMDARKITWSFDSGPPLYSSYQAPSSNYFIDVGDDWEFYAHSERFGKENISLDIEDFVKKTPLILVDGSIILGSWKSTAFNVDALTGRLVCTYSLSDSPSSSNGSSKTVCVGSLTITRTDYELQSFAQNSSKIMWNLRVAKRGTALICQFDGEPGDIPSSCHSRVSVLSFSN